ncbi:MAG: hypothetical protein QOE41_4935 [Mycobacterium sp.]|nr:hypothetical protein [Mycobacterium sp.]MDT5135624.1 hypothetical protein [Mycobacterium sp.]
MRTTNKTLLSAAAATLLATAGSLVSPVPSRADDVLHNVRYTVTADNPIYADIYYLDQEPPNFADYSHNPYQFVPNIQADIGPGKPWTYDLMLADPNQWALVTASTGTEPGTPNFHCQLSVDGAVVARKDSPKGVLCSLHQW